MIGPRPFRDEWRNLLRSPAVNCPVCSAPLLFGATSCPCGYNAAAAKDDQLPIELSYGESLRAFWRIYWPSQVLGGVVVFATAAIFPPAAVLVAVQILVTAAMLFAFVPRVCGRPYRGFSLVLIDVATGETSQALTGSRRARVTIFLWWRQILAGLFAALLAMPLNALLSMIGVQVAQWAALLAGVLVIGPILLKMLIGHEFGDFRMEARRPVSTAGAAPAAIVTSREVHYPEKS